MHRNDLGGNWYQKIIELKPLSHWMSCLNIVSISSFIFVKWLAILRTQPGFIYVSQSLITFNICMFDYSFSLCEVLLIVVKICVWLFVTPWTSACLAPLSPTISRNLLKSMSIESAMLSNHLPLSSPSPLALNLSQHQGLFQWVDSLHQGAKVLELQPQHQSFQWIFRVAFLRVEWLDLPASKGLSRVFSSITIQKHQFFRRSTKYKLFTRKAKGNHQIKIIAFIYWEGILYQPFAFLGWIVVQDEGTFWMSVFSPGFYAC